MVKMKNVGQVLSEAREQKKLTIEAVSNAIKIRPSLIEALEKGEYFAFSSDIHLKSFLRAYANYLGIHTDKIMALYRRDRQVHGEDGKDKSKSKNKFSLFSISLSEFFTYKTFLSLLALFGLFIAFFFFYKQYVAFTKPPRLEILGPKQNEVLKQDSFVIEGFTGDPSIKVTVDGKEGNYVDALGKFRVNARFAAEGVNQFQVIAENQFGKKTNIELSLIYQPEKKDNEQKVRIKNISAELKTVTIFKDSIETPEVLNIEPNTTAEVIYTQKLEMKDYDKNSFELYLNNDAEPTKAIDSSSFSIIIENQRPIIKQEAEGTTPTPSQ